MSTGGTEPSGPAGSPQPPDAMACGICAKPLFPVRSGGEIVMWLHREELSGLWGQIDDIPAEVIERLRATAGHDPVDHLAVPVPIGDVQTETICDFCSLPNPRWKLPVEPFEANAQQAFAKDFALCDVCARLLKKGRWDDVMGRALDTASAKYKVSRAEPGLVSGLTAFIEQIKTHQTGPPERV